MPEKKKKKKIEYPPEVHKFVVDNRELGFSYPEILEMMQKKLPKELWDGLELPTVRGIGYRILGRTGHPQGRNAKKASQTKLVKTADDAEQAATDKVIQSRVQVLKDQGYSPSHIAKFLENKFGVLKTASEINRMSPKGNNLKHPEVGLDWGKDLEFIELKIKVPVKQAAKALLALFGGYI